MLSNRPRGIAFNKNALNIQLGNQPSQLDEKGHLVLGKPAPKSPNEPSPPKLRSLKPPAPIKDENQYDEIELAKAALVKEAAREVLAAKLADKEVEEANLVDLENLKQQPESQQPQGVPSITSKIPRLSIRLPMSNLLNRQPSQQPHLQPLKKVQQLDLQKVSSSLSLKLAPNHERLASVRLDEQQDEDSEEADETEEIEDIDKSTSRDAIFLVSDIAKDIYSYMFALELAQPVDEGFLQNQKIYTPKVRQRLINWCIDIHSQLNLLTETLYMTVALIDRYFSQVQVKQQSQVQLVAVGATLIASKYEEIYPPDVSDLITLTQDAYSRRDVMRIEITILEQLNFNLGRPIPIAFLRRFSKAAHCYLKTHSIAKYLMELSLCEYECSHWRPSMLAAAALFVTLHLVRDGTGNSQQGQHNRWTRSLVHHTRYSKKELLKPASILCGIVKRSQKCPQSYSCVKKNAQNLSKWPELKSARVDELLSPSLKKTARYPFPGSK